MRLNYFNFEKIKDQILLTNDMGRYLFLTEDDFKRTIGREMVPGSDLENRLIEAGMIIAESELSFSEKNRYAVQELKGHVLSATSLHIFVVTTACNLDCVYCQANNGSVCSNLFMDEQTAEKSVDIALSSPERQLSFEFQGGEPLLNYKIIKHIVEYAEERKGDHEINYNIVTNLTLLEDEMIQFFKDHCFGISTSVDGSDMLHNKNRRFRDGSGSFEKVKDSVMSLREADLYVGAIETTTRDSLGLSERIVETYIELGFESIFIRPLTPLGKAAKVWNRIGYTPEEFLEFYLNTVDLIIDANKRGTYLKEDYLAILAGRIQGDYINYMELRSPCGAGIGQLAYYSDGNIFTCDEGRMLFEMGDDSFMLGNVNSSTYESIITNGICRTACAASILETIPSCCDCVYQPYCGVCPVINYALQNDVIEKSPRGYKCRINRGILNYIFLKYLENDERTIDIIRSWCN